MKISKVPEVTFSFWIIKIIATTLGETGGDALSMSINLGYAVSTGIFLCFFIIAASLQIVVKTFHPVLYWIVIVATTTTGTTMADYADRSLGIGYVGGSLILFITLAMSLGLWRFLLGSISVDSITSRKAELFYWLTILFSNTLGTAFGDFMVDSSGFGYTGSALFFSMVLMLIAITYFITNLPRTLLFWVAFIFTRPLGSTLGDMLTKPHDHGGLDLSRISSSAIIALLMFVCIFAAEQRGKLSK